METLKIEIPKGYEVEDFDKSTGVVKFKETPKDITERIKYPEDAIKDLGEDDIDVIDYRKLLAVGVSDHIINHQLAIIITKALNEGWEPDWDNDNELKYELVFKMGSSGFRYYDYDGWGACSRVGSRRCFRERRLGLYAGEKFPDVFKNFMLIQKSKS